MKVFSTVRSGSDGPGAKEPSLPTMLGEPTLPSEPAVTRPLQRHGDFVRCSADV
jgi:hypothetical protein